MTRHRDKLFRFLRVGSVERYDPVFNVWSELELRENVSRVAIGWLSNKPLSKYTMWSGAHGRHFFNQ